jgi:hypothetical protein
MNKKIIITVLALFALITVVGTVFAGGDVSITKRDTSITVTRADKTVPVTGTMCINMERTTSDGKVAKNQDWWDFDLSGNKQTATWNAPSGWKIVSYSNVMCTIE